MGEMFAFSNICRFSYINSHTKKQINTLLPKIKVFHFLLLRMFKLFCFSSGVDTNGSSHPVGHWDHIPATNPLVKWWAITQEHHTRAHNAHRSIVYGWYYPYTMEQPAPRTRVWCSGGQSLEDRAPVDFIQGWPVDRWAPGATGHITGLQRQWPQQWPHGYMPLWWKPTAITNVNKIQTTQRKRCPSINDPLYLLLLTRNICYFLLQTTYSVGRYVSA